MDTNQLLIGLLDGLYRSTVEPEVWQQTLDALLEIFRSQHAFLFTTKTADLIAPLLVTAGIDDKDRNRFLTHEANRAFEPISTGIVPGVAAGIQDVIRLNDFEQSEFYNEIVKPTRCFYSGFVRGNEPDLSFHLALCRPSQQGAFERGETDLLQRLLPHLTTALTVRQRLHVGEQTTAGFEGMIERVDKNAMLIDAGCRPVFVNSRASRLLASRSGLALVNGQLQGPTSALTSQLHHLVAKVSDGNHAHVERMYLPQPSGSLPLLVDILPVWRLGLAETGRGAARVAIVITQPDAPFAADIMALQDVFKLTPRESEIAALLADGAPVEMIAKRLTLTPGTVRYNLQRIFDKAGVHSQGALVALVHRFGPRRDPIH
jgi:DNA-binding CsgD family transcriptional regulator